MGIPSRLMPSHVKVWRPQVSMQDGILTTAWISVSGLEDVRCRLEVNFYRPGKDAPLPIQAGRAPDRACVYWVDPGTDFRPGDHLECVSGPVFGVWRVQTRPDSAVSMRYLHHLEGQAIEVHSSIVMENIQ